jgi:hypothetical protein
MTDKGRPRIGTATAQAVARSERPDKPAASTSASAFVVLSARGVTGPENAFLEATEPRDARRMTIPSRQLVSMRVIAPPPILADA